MAGAGATSFTFTGRRAGVLFRKGPNLGKASVAVDGGPAHIVDLYRSTPGSRWWTAAFDAVGRHRVRIAWTGRRNDSSTGSLVAVDAVAAIAEAAPTG
ncbi:MAG: hypothetical protein ACJ77A_02245 [Actinomycetota bacterium]